MGDTFRRIIILKSMAKDGFVSTQDESLIIMFTYMEIELEKNPKIYEALIAFYIFWFTYKTIYVLALIFTLPALFKGNTKMYKMLLYVTIPNCLSDIIVIFTVTTIINYGPMLRNLLFLCILFEGYDILAVSSEYKRLTGKLKPRYTDIEADYRTQPWSQSSTTFGRDLRYNTQHCGTCTCHETFQSLQPVSTNQMSNFTQSNATSVTDKQISDFELNYALTGILNLEDVAEEPSTSCMRPNTLDSKLNTTDDEKIVVTDEPIIYDVNQLNIGASTVIEDKEL
ncbi:uncharacterized protein LOC116770918 isoform X3 [Danaus plexippus]|nr:uncharacterized protein LOC116770918 isoform X3 [Danaus plexippus]